MWIPEDSAKGIKLGRLAPSWFWHRRILADSREFPATEGATTRQLLYWTISRGRAAPFLAALG